MKKELSKLIINDEFISMVLSNQRKKVKLKKGVKYAL